MQAVEQYQADYFAITVLVVIVLTFVFLIVSAVYFSSLMNMKPPSKGESTFLFWTAIILAAIFFVVAIFALIRIFTHKVVVYVAPIQQMTKPPGGVQVNTTTVTKTLPPDRVVISRNVSDVPVSKREKKELLGETISLGSAVSGP